MDAAPLALLGLAVGTRGVLMPVARCPPHGGRRFVCTMCEEPPASQRGVVEVPPGATRVPEAEAARHPAEPDRAISIVAELRSNAALFAAFAFGALSLPNTLVIWSGSGSGSGSGRTLAVTVALARCAEPAEHARDLRESRDEHDVLTLDLTLALTLTLAPA